MNLAKKQASFLNDQEKTSVVGASPRIPTAILGLGNRLRGDDWAGCAVVDLLASTRELPENICFMEDATSDLFDAILSSRYERVILVDAAEINRRPGEWICLNADWLTWNQKNKDKNYDGHRFSLLNILALGRALGTLPGEVLIYAIQPLSLEWTGTLSEPVRKAVTEISESILREIRANP
jgi:hydrogenase maturation protease